MLTEISLQSYLPIVAVLTPSHWYDLRFNLDDMPQRLLEKVDIGEQQYDDDQYVDQGKHRQQIGLGQVLGIEAEFRRNFGFHGRSEVGDA